ncbi:hypothetical protein [Geminocystis sp. NIES-3709]|uniref:hypothetical protein n=1 Tax=Geminocystis sp. NIES-3709 TaxID=1617448 RepID=UPI0005FC7FE8|nr:hypothetical protein [Geminocystis sp. NIES-3709]BAQ65484.1 hypothetical protein GM3709_2249 [Geminocystis sp. NIES-3709]
MLPFFRDFFHQYNFYLQPFYFVIAWGLFGLLILSLVTTIRDIGKSTKTMHQIPCTECSYFTNNYYLKCTLRPSIANTELAIDCPDFMIRKS